MSADDLRLQPKMTTALEIAVLCQAIPIQQAADLIEQYARTVASCAKVDATAEAYDNVLCRISREMSDAQG